MISGVSSNWCAYAGVDSAAAREALVSLLEGQQRDAECDRRDRAQDLDDLALALVVLAGPRSFRLGNSAAILRLEVLLGPCITLLSFRILERKLVAIFQDPRSLILKDSRRLGS